MMTMGIPFVALLEIVQAIAFRPERGSAIEWHLPVGHQQALGHRAAVAGVREGRRGGYF